MRASWSSNRFAIWVGALTIVVNACSREKKPSPTPAGPQEEEVVLAGAPVLVGAGDIAVCGTAGDESTAAIVDSVLRANSAQKVQTLVATFGDNAYPSGSQGVTDDFPRCFSPSWGRPRIMSVLHTSPGNHDYDSRSGGPYFAYFGSRAGPAGKGYYSYDVGGWHILSLNSELYFEDTEPDHARAQETWLREDLKQHQSLCALAYFHRPLFSSGKHGNTRQVKNLWEILFSGGVDLVVNGHDHDYERFLPQTPEGAVDSAKGMEQIVAGTGGGALTRFRYRLARNSAAHIQGRFGILKVTLGEREYRHAFLDTDGRVWDAGGRKCH